MAQTCETPAVEAGAPRNNVGRLFHLPNSLPDSTPQAIPYLIALHVGERFLARLIEGGAA